MYVVTPPVDPVFLIITLGRAVPPSGSRPSATREYPARKVLCMRSVRRDSSVRPT